MFSFTKSIDLVLGAFWIIPECFTQNNNFLTMLCGSLKIWSQMEERHHVLTWDKRFRKRAFQIFLCYTEIMTPLMIVKPWEAATGPVKAGTSLSCHKCLYRIQKYQQLCEVSEACFCLSQILTSKQNIFRIFLHMGCKNAQIRLRNCVKDHGRQWIGFTDGILSRVVELGGNCPVYSTMNQHFIINFGPLTSISGTWTIDSVQEEIMSWKGVLPHTKIHHVFKKRRVWNSAFIMWLWVLSRYARFEKSMWSC